MSTDDPWGYAKAYSYLVLRRGQMLVDFNGNPATKKIDLALADGLLAHRRQDANGHYFLSSAIHFVDDKDSVATRAYFPLAVFWSAWKWTGDRKYLDPIFDGGTTSLMQLNANALDILGIRKTWGPRI